jgi:hypothetical protein
MLDYVLFLFPLLAIPLNRLRGEEGFALVGRVGLAGLPAIPALSHSLWLASLVFIASYAGIIVSHNRYFNLKTWRQYVGLSMTGLAYTAPASVAFIITGSPMSACAFAIAGMLKPAAYKTSIEINNTLGQNRDHLPLAEWLFGAILCVGLIPAFWSVF